MVGVGSADRRPRPDMRKADWKVGGMVIVPAEGTFHQHFNTGPTRARYMAHRMKSFVSWCNGMVGPTNERET